MLIMQEEVSAIVAFLGGCTDAPKRALCPDSSQQCAQH
jgi:hypothetical protein